MHRFALKNLSTTARAAILSFALLGLVLIAMWGLRTIVKLPAFLPHLGRGGIDGSNVWQVVLALAIVMAVFGTPLFLLIRRNQEIAAAKQAILAREAEFRAYAEAGSDWLWATDDQGRLTNIVGGKSAEFESERKRILGKTLDEVVGPNQIIADASRWRQFHDDIAAGRPFRNFEIRIRDRRGKRRYLNLSATPTFDAAGVFAGYRGVTTDITEQKEAEIALRESQQRITDFASSASDWFWETDKDHRFTFSSGRIKDVRGNSSTHAVGHTRFELSSERDRRIRPDAWSQHQDDLDNQRPFRNFEYEINANGQRRILVTGGVPLFDANGQFTGYRGSATDVTEYRRAEREALDYLRQFRTLADNLPILIANFDADWRFLYVNHMGEVWFDRPREEIIGRPFAEIAGRELDAASIQSRQRVLAGESVRQETVTRFPDGKTRTIQRTLLPDCQPGEPMRIQLMAIDVTEQRQLEEQVRQNLKMEALGNLTGGVAHDFNNLLLAIQGNLEFLREEPLDDDLKSFVQNALRGVDRAADLTRRLLAFSRRQPLAPRAVDVGRLVIEMEALLRRTLETYVDLQIDAGDTPEIALIDPGQLENAILNLAINGRDAMPEGGRLTVRVRGLSRTSSIDNDRGGATPQASPYVCVEVEDDGIGMPDSVREHAFEPFFTTKQVGHGTGLGLAMVHGFVTQSGGIAEIDTEPGSGTTIRLLLPTAAAQDQQLDAPATKPVPVTNGGSALLVEDDDLVRAVAERHLSDLGYEVVAVAAPSDACAVLRGPRSVDLMVTDLLFGRDIEGLELAEKARERWPDLSIVLMSGYSDIAENRERAKRLNAQIIAKPFSRAALAEAIVAGQPAGDEDVTTPTPLRAAG